MINYSNHIEPSEVYLYTLKVVGGNVFYIGKTKNPNERLRCHLSGTQQHSNKKKNGIIQDTIKSGGKIEMNVFWGGRNDEWEKEERFWISKFKYDWQIPIVNIQRGGNGVEFTEEVRSKISVKLKGKKLLETTKEKMRGRVAWNKGKKMHAAKKVEQLDNGRVVNVFNSIKEAGEILGFNRGNISLVVNGKRKTLGGYGFRYSNS